jgi:ABC-type sugar transport system substrate-binding protein
MALSTGRYLLAKMNGKGNVIIIEGVGGRSAVPRVRGFKTAIGSFQT